MAVIGSITVNILGDSTSLTKALSRSQRQLQSFSTNVSSSLANMQGKMEQSFSKASSSIGKLDKTTEASQKRRIQLQQKSNSIQTEMQDSFLKKNGNAHSDYIKAQEAEQKRFSKTLQAHMMERQKTQESYTKSLEKSTSMAAPITELNKFKRANQQTFSSIQKSQEAYTKSINATIASNHFLSPTGIKSINASSAQLNKTVSGITTSIQSMQKSTIGANSFLSPKGIKDISSSATQLNKTVDGITSSVQAMQKSAMTGKVGLSGGNILFDNAALKKTGNSINALNGQMVKAQKTSNDTAKRVRGLDAGFLELTGSILKAAPAFAVATSAIHAVHAAVRAVTTEFMNGFVAVEDYKQNVISMAAFMTTFSKRAAEGDIAGAYQESVTYAGQLVQKLELIDAYTIANAQDLRVITESFIKQGVILDVNNEKQVQGFINITNAVKLMTKGQNQQIQLRQEIRALAKGELRESNLLVKTLQSINPQIKSQIKLWKEEGTLIENVGEMLKGFGPASSDFQRTFAAAGTTMQTIHDKILRGAFAKTFDYVIDQIISINKSLMDADGNLTSLGTTIQESISSGLDKVTEILGRTAVEIKTLVGIYNSLPEGSTVGIIGAILIGRGNVLAGALIVANELMSKTGNSVGDLASKYESFHNSVLNSAEAVRLGLSSREYGEYLKVLEKISEYELDFMSSHKKPDAMTSHVPEIARMGSESEAIKEIEKQIEGLEKQAAIYGKSKRELALYNIKQGEFKELLDDSRDSSGNLSKELQAVVDKYIKLNTALDINTKHKKLKEAREEFEKFTRSITDSLDAETLSPQANVNKKYDSMIEDLKLKFIELKDLTLFGEGESFFSDDELQKLKKFIDEINKLRDVKLTNLYPVIEPSNMKKAVSGVGEDAPDTTMVKKELEDYLKLVGDTKQQLDDILFEGSLVGLSDVEANTKQVRRDFEIMVNGIEADFGGMGKDIPESIKKSLDSIKEGNEKAIKEYAETASAAYKLTEELSEGFKETTSDIFYDMLQAGEFSFKSLADSFKSAISRMVADALAADLTKSLFGGETSGSSSLGNLLAAGAKFFAGGLSNEQNKLMMDDFAQGNALPSAKGNIFNNGSLIPFEKGGIVNTPTTFPMTEGTGLMGEAGPEGILPLKRGANGDLGVNAQGISGKTEINIINNAGANIEVKESKKAGGGQRIDVILDKAVKNSIEVGRGNRALNNLGLSPQLAGR